MWQKISIIIPVLNEANNIESFLLPLQALREQGHEVILVDGQSQDDTCKLARPYVDRMMSAEKGRAKQQILGAKIATGQIFCFLHADTLLPPNADHVLLMMLAQVLETTQTNFWGRFDVRLSGQHWFFRVIESMMNWRSCLTGIATGDQAIFVSKTLYYKVGGIPLIDIMEDIEFSHNLRKEEAIICIKDPVITSSRRWEEKGILKTILLMWTLRLQYFLGAKPEQLLKKYYPGHGND